MALVKCPECGREKVSDSAEACPDCGFNIKQYFLSQQKDVFYSIDIYNNKKFEFLNGFDEGVNGIYSSDADRNYYVKDGLVYLPGGTPYLLTEKFLLEVKENGVLIFEDTIPIPKDETFNLTICSKHFITGKSNWTFTKEGIVRNEEGEKGVYRRKGDFLAYKMSNSSSSTLRDKTLIFFLHNDRIYFSGFVKEKYVNEVMTLKNEVQCLEYPFAVSAPLESNDYSYSTANVPKCPTCQSTNLKKITGLSKAGSVAMWGIFAAGRTSKTWHCNNCGSEW